MPKQKSSLAASQYLEDHQRNICPGCSFWVLWYNDKKGKPVYGCQVGLIPYKDKCPARKKRSREKATVNTVERRLKDGRN